MPIKDTEMATTLHLLYGNLQGWLQQTKVLASTPGDFDTY